MRNSAASVVRNMGSRSPRGVLLRRNGTLFRFDAHLFFAKKESVLILRNSLAMPYEVVVKSEAAASARRCEIASWAARSRFNNQGMAA